MDIGTIWTIPVVLILATGLPTALAAHTHSHTQTHSPAYLYGLGLGKNAVTRGYYDVMNDCSNRPYLSTNVTGAIKNFTSLQQVNDCDSGYDDGWNKYCHMGLAKHPDVAANCPISGPKTETESSQY
ncbi:MAG: hypothetical protein WBZ36_22305 [Candidatus Nitrosopolaris sp.]